MVICDEPQYHDPHRDVVLNPRLIIEVLSASTEAFDRGEKFLRYNTWNPTLTDYLLVSQSRPLIEHFVRQHDGGWSYYVYQGLDQSLPLHSIACTLRHGSRKYMTVLCSPPSHPQVWTKLTPSLNCRQGVPWRGVSVMGANATAPRRMTQTRVDGYGCCIHVASAGPGIFYEARRGHRFWVGRHVGERL
jgi:hypothetical protein